MSAGAVFGFAQKRQTDELKQIWRLCFGAEQSYLDSFFDHYYHPARTAVAQKDGRVAAMLFLIPMQAVFRDKALPAYYIYGVGTHPDFRGQGLSTQLLEFTHGQLKREGCALSVLVPASQSLFEFYRNRGYDRQVIIGEAAFQKEELCSNDCAHDRLVLADAKELSQLRCRHFADYPLRLEWNADDTLRLAQTQAYKQSGAFVLQNVQGEKLGYAMCVLDGNTLLVQELAVEAGNFFRLAGLLSKEYPKAEKFHFRFRADYLADYVAQRPYAAVRWYRPELEQNEIAMTMVLE